MSDERNKNAVLNNEGSSVLVGGYKPEDIQRNYLEKKRRDEEEMARQIEAGARGARGSSTASGTGANPDHFHMEDLGEFYRIRLLFDSDVVGYEFTKTLLSQNARADQKGWFNYNSHCDIYDKNCTSSFPVASASIYMDIFSILEENKDHPTYKGMIEEARNGLVQIITRTLVMTTTSLTYDPKGRDTVRIGSSKQKEYRSLRVTDGELRDGGNDLHLSIALFGLATDKVKTTTKWLCYEEPRVQGFEGPRYGRKERRPISFGLYSAPNAGVCEWGFLISSNPELSLPAIGARALLHAGPLPPPSKPKGASEPHRFKIKHKKTVKVLR